MAPIKFSDGWNLQPLTPSAENSLFHSFLRYIFNSTRMESAIPACTGKQLVTFAPPLTDGR